MSRNYNYMINASKHSKGSASHWLRYLRKVIFEDKIILSDDDIKRLLESKELDYFQKVTLRFGVQKNSPTYNHIISLNKKFVPNINEIFKRYFGEDFEFGKKRTYD